MTGTNIEPGNPQDGSNRLQGAVVLSGQLSPESTLRQLFQQVCGAQTVRYGLFRVLSKGVRGYIGIESGDVIIGAHVTSTHSFGVKALRELLSADKGLYVFMSMAEHPIEVRQSLNLKLSELLKWKEDAFAETPSLVEALDNGFPALHEETATGNTEFGAALAQGLITDSASADKEAFEALLAWGGGEAASAPVPNVNLNKITGSFRLGVKPLASQPAAPMAASPAPSSAAEATGPQVTLTPFPQTSTAPVPPPQLIKPDSQAITAPQAFPKIPPSQPQPPQPAPGQFPMQPQPSAPSAFDQPSPFAKPATAPMQRPQPSQSPQQPHPSQTPQSFPQSTPQHSQLQSPESAGNKGWTLADLDSIGSPGVAQSASSPGPQATRGAGQQQQVMDDLDRALTGQPAAPRAEDDAGEAAAKPTTAGTKLTASRIRPISKQDEELKELVSKTTAPMDRKAFLADGPRQVMSIEQRKKFELTAIAGGIVGVGLFLALGQQVFNIVTGSQKYNTGVRALKSGDNVLAQVEMTAAIKLNGNANSLLYRAIAETRLGRLEKAMEDYNSILRINPRNQLALAGRAGLFLKQKKYDDVIIDADRMLKNKGDDADGLRLRALALAAKGDYKRAADDATNCLAVMSQDEAFDAQRAVVLSTRAYCYFKVNKFDEAIADYSKAIECDKANVHLYSSRATTYKCVKAWKKALDDAEMAIKLDPGDNTLYKLRGQCYSGAGEALKAAEDLDTAVKIKPTLESFFARGEARLAAKDFSGAMEDFEYCLTVNPNNRVAKAKYDEARKNLYDSALHREAKPSKAKS